MKQLKQDRRSQRTQRLLGDALLALMHEKSYDSITVQDILDRADVGRSTFYAHYLDKEDLLMHRLQQVVKVLEEQGARADSRAFILPSMEFLRHAWDFRNLYRALVWGNSVAIPMKYFHDHLCAVAVRQLAALVPSDAPLPVPLPVLADFVVGTFVSLLRWWLDSNQGYTPEQIDAMFWHMVRPGVESVLGIHLPSTPAS